MEVRSAAVADEARVSEAWRLSRMIVSVAELSKLNFAENIAPFGLPVHLARTLLLLDEPAPMSELAEQLGCDRSWITSLADQLEERGLVTRVAGRDRRFKLIALTDSGTALRDQMTAAVARKSMVLQRLTDEERALLGPLLERLLKAPAR